MPAKRDDSLDVLEVVDRVLSAALREVRRVRARDFTPPEEQAPTGGKRKSNTAICVDVLNAVERPLHVSALLAALEQVGVHTTRESLVSAITKKLAPAGPFVRTAGNTFGLAGRDQPADEV